MKRVIFSFLLSAVPPFLLQAQTNVALIGSDPLWAGVEQNVGRPFPRLISIGLPNVYVGESTTFPSLDTLLLYSSPQDLHQVFPERFYGQLNARFGLLSLGVRVFERHHIRVSGEGMMEGFVEIPRDLPDLILNGNAPYIGDTLDLGIRLRFQSYDRYTLDYVWAAPQYSLGAAIHYYRGWTTVNLMPDQFGLYTHDTTLHLTLMSDATLAATADTALVREWADGNVDSLNVMLDRRSPIGNGIGFSIGGRVRLLGFLNLSGNWANVGTIKWRTGSVYRIKSSYTFRGLDVADVLHNDTAAVQSVIDSVKTAFTPTFSHTSFSTPTTQRFFLRADIVFDQFSFLPVGFVLAGEKNARWRLTYGAYLNMAFLPPLSMTFSASYRPLGVKGRSYKTAAPNINWGLMLHGHIAKVFSYYVGTDNVPWRGIFRGQWDRFRHLDVTAGFALHFGARNPYYKLRIYTDEPR